MSATSYGGIRGRARASLSASLGLTPDEGQAATGGGIPSRPAGMARGPAGRIGPDTAPVLLALVAVELAFLFGARLVFRNYHGG